jgi:hypothetical protein
VLGEKSTELNHLQIEIEKKDAHRATLADIRAAEFKQDLQRVIGRTVVGCGNGKRVANARPEL